MNKDTENECFITNYHNSNTQQPTNDRDKSKKNNQIVDRYLHKRIIGIPIGKIRPYKDHCGTGCCPENYRAGNIFSCQGRIDKGCKYLSEKYPCKECHGKWLYQPVHDQC